MFFCIFCNLHISCYFSYCRLFNWNQVFLSKTQIWSACRIVVYSYANTDQTNSYKRPKISTALARLRLEFGLGKSWVMGTS